MYLSVHRPHPPYDPPAWAFEQYLDAAMPDPPVGDWTALYDGWAEPHDPQSPVGEVDPRWLRRARAGYYGHMTHIDHQLNRFLEVLHEFRLRENTYVCFTSDHGELMGDHHLFRKSLPYEGSARVPLLLKGPRDAGITPGITPTEAAELRDVMPTLLDCAGLPIPEGLDGRSLLPLARGESVDWRLGVHGEHTTLGQSAHWLTDGREKYIWLSGSGDEQLFDLSEDPQELHDLSRRGDPRLQRWRDRMVLTLRDRPEGFVSDGALVPGRPVSPILEGSLAAESARSAQVGRPSL